MKYIIAIIAGIVVVGLMTGSVEIGIKIMDWISERFDNSDFGRWIAFIVVVGLVLGILFALCLK